MLNFLVRTETAERLFEIMKYSDLLLKVRGTMSRFFRGCVMKNKQSVRMHLTKLLVELS